MQVITAASDPDYRARTRGIEVVWPAYNLHGTNMNRHWGRLWDDFPASQFSLVQDGELLVIGHAAPVPWGGTAEGLPAGIDGAIESAFATLDGGGQADALCAFAVQVRPEAQGRGLSRTGLEAMVAIARELGLADLIAPVRPSAKERYPLTPIEEYAYWRRDDGLPFDPWMRVHARMGATILKAEPLSLLIEAPVADWEEWTGMAFPADGSYWFPRGLAPLRVEAGRGVYHEPNVWMRHRVS